MAIKFLNNVAVDSDVLYVDTVNNNVGIGTTSPGAKIDVELEISFWGNMDGSFYVCVLHLWLGAAAVYVWLDLSKYSC